MTTEIQRIARRHESARDFLAELRIRADTSSIHRPDPSIVSVEREDAYHRLGDLTKPYLGMQFADIRWSVIGDVALVNYGSSTPAKKIDILVDLLSKPLLEKYFSGRGIAKGRGGEHHGFKYTEWGDFVVHYYHLEVFPELEPDVHCATTKGWPLCNHSAVIAWSMRDFTINNLANVVDVLIGGLQINWKQVRYWSKVFGFDDHSVDLEKIYDSIIQDDEVWGDLIV